jgi:hypothetical protein
MILKTCIYSLTQQNRSALTLNHETEVCMKEEYATEYIYLVHERKWIFRI